MPHLILVLAAALTLAPQGNPIIDWLTSLQSMQARLNGADAARDAIQVTTELRALQAEIAAWSAAQPDGGIRAAAVPENPQELLPHIASLRQMLEQVERNRPGSSFYMGRVDVNVSASAVQVPTAGAVDQSEIREHNYHVITDALNHMPGVSIQRIGARNESGVYVRGFDIRQVPLYIDGIPVYLPYDGYVDMNRFLTHSLGEIQVAKGFTSPLYGPNAIGGAINLISQAPTKPLNVDFGVGYGSGGERSGYLNIGARWTRFWVQGGIEGVQSDAVPLSSNFQTVATQPDFRRANSYQKDYKGSIRFAWTPNANDAYSFTYANQRGEKGNPPYAGTDPAVRIRFWQWPEWNKESFYFIGNKSLGDRSYVRLRLFYDKLNNLLKSYDNATYSSQTLNSSFSSPYDDDSYGTTVEFGTHALPRQTLKASFYFKDDTHRQGNIGSIPESFRNQSHSFGIEDTVQIMSRAYAVFGFSVDGLRVLNAENIENGQTVPFPRHDVTSYNPQAGIFYSVTESGRLHFTFARKTRLPTMKDRYSYRMGQGVPNPELREEKSNNWEIGYSQVLGTTTYLSLAVFRSDLTDSTQRFFLQPNLFQFRNIGKSRYMGGEIGITTTPVQAVTLSANYTYLNRENLSHPAVIPIDTPRHKVYASAAFRFMNRFTAMTDLRHETGRWAQNDASNYRRVAPYTVVSIGGTAEIYPNTQIQLGVDNLFDRDYIITDGFPEAGRTAYANMRYRF